MNDVTKLAETYSESYCEFLEAAYGSDMMSEGGAIAIERMFNTLNLQNKKILDIGSGLGGLAFYLAEHHHAYVTGIEISESLVEMARNKTPSALKSHVNFVVNAQAQLPFEANSFDIVCSKGVLVHVKNKLPLFQEIYRVVKPDGYFIIDDWLSPTSHKWGERLQHMAEAENLILHAETETEYKKVLQTAGFTNINMRDENENYTQYNRNIVERLQQSKVANFIIDKFGQKDYDLAVASYQTILESIIERELLIRWFSARKLDSLSV